MASSFQSDLDALLAEPNASRAELVSVLQAVSDADLDGGRRGGWPVRRVLEHVIQSEHLYATLVSHLRGLSVEPHGQVTCEGQSADQILCELDSSRHALLSALDGVDEDSFYRLGRIGHEEYSVMSVLENVANHDREHAAQAAPILAVS